MVSEDSQHLGWFSVIHRLLDLRDLNDSIETHVSSKFHELDDLYELLEILSLRSSQWVLSEERDDLGSEVFESVDVEPKEILLVVVPPSIDVDLAAPKESL